MNGLALIGLLALPAFILAGCGDVQPSGGSELGLVPHDKQSPVGVWERRFEDAVGQRNFEVLELYGDSSYVRHASGWVADRGDYTLNQGNMVFRSETNTRHNREVRIELRGGTTMTMTATGPFPVAEEWSRSSLQPNFPTVEIGGKHVPQGLPGLAAAALASEALPWRDDAVPVGVSVQQQENGHYSVEFSFHAPSTVEMMRITVTRYDVSRSTHDGSRTATAALPPVFLDLPEAIAAANASGVPGPLKRASVQTYPRHGAVWFINTSARHGANVSAESGQPIDGDVTGFVAGYDADWKRAGELWRTAIERVTPKREKPWKHEDLYKYTSKDTCEQTGGGTWHRSQGHHGGYCS